MFLIPHLKKYFRIYVYFAFILALVVVRMYVTGSFKFGFYFLNIFLALLPLWIMSGIKSLKSIRSWIALSTMILFLPNTPYLVTDLKHFAMRPEMIYWYDLIIHACVAIGGVGVWYLISNKLKRVVGQTLGSFHLWYVPFCVLISIGIYIGRFFRFHTIDILTQPRIIMIEIWIEMTSNHQHFWSYVVLMSVFLWLTYYFFYAVSYQSNHE